MTDNKNCPFSNDYCKYKDPLYYDSPLTNDKIPTVGIADNRCPAGDQKSLCQRYINYKLLQSARNKIHKK
ncbi:MAG: hypothetical protein MJ187_01310 [Alphaproteobacteria bacterium]|nr:hypothetical protein [Alphaproteobacteria bacterium]